jgi:hypothetical protein
VEPSVEDEGLLRDDQRLEQAVQEAVMEFDPIFLISELSKSWSSLMAGAMSFDKKIEGMNSFICSTSNCAVISLFSYSNLNICHIDLW